MGRWEEAVNVQYKTHPEIFPLRISRVKIYFKKKNITLIPQLFKEFLNCLFSVISPSSVFRNKKNRI